MPPTTSTSFWMTRRYEHLGVLGRGSTGTVHRAHDRLHRRIVALKTATAESPDAGVFASRRDSQLGTSELLSREFVLLNRLRHPNVIASLDYGHDETGRAFFTMDLQDNARTLREAARHEPATVRIDLLVQLLHALAYLHRRGLVHRDVKPENVLCAGGFVKLVDFGLAVEAGHVDERPSGTLAYCAPEVLRGGPTSEKADLYAVGVIAYEMVAGRHPFDTSSSATLLRSVFHGHPDLGEGAVEPRIGAVLRRLLARDPADRFDSAIDVIAELGRALDRRLPIETPSTRESFLQGAELVGRDAEMRRLRASLPEPGSPGRAIVLSGESGVGKTRMLEELAVDAMVGGARVLRGQARHEGSRPYEPWRSVLRLLAMLTEPNDFETSVVAAVVPDVASVLGRDLPKARELDPEATHLRLVRVIEALLRRCPVPLVVVLEDMQWAGTESLKLFQRVQALAPEVAFLLIASCRAEGRAIPKELSEAEHIALDRLGSGDVARLCNAVLGAPLGEESKSLVDVVWRESRGNAFAALEVLRALADEAGGLERLATFRSDDRVGPRSARLVDRRVQGLSDTDRAFLRTAAIAGRELDLDVLSAVHPDLDVRHAAARAAEATLLSSVQGRWWFAHDKLRDAIVDALSDDERRRIHAALARAVVAVAPRSVSTLAHHFRAAGDSASEKTYAALAGEEFLRTGAYHEAIPYLTRALELFRPNEDRPTERIERARLQRQRGEALFRCGKLAEGRRSLAASLATLGRPLPETPLRLGRELLLASFEQLRLRTREARGRARPPAVADLPEYEEAILAYTELSRLAHHLNDERLVLCVTLGALNLSEQGGFLEHHARLAAVMGAVMGLVPAHPWARTYFARAHRLCAALGETSVEAFVLAHQGYYEAGVGDWRACQAHLQRSIDLYDEIGDVRLGEESISILAYALCYQGDTRRSLELFRRLERSGEERADQQIVSWGLVNRIRLLVRTGQKADLERLLVTTDGLVVDSITKAVRDGARIDLAMAHGDLSAAREAAVDAASFLERSGARSFMVCSTYSSIAAAFLACWAETRGTDDDLGRAALRANRELARIARVFPIAEPARLLHAGSFEALRRRPTRSRLLWERAARLAAERTLPFEEGRARDALAGRPHPSSTRERPR